MAAKTLATVPIAPDVTATDTSMADLRRKIERLIADPETWLNTPHPLLAEHRPAEFLQAGRERPLRDLIAAIEYGQFA